MSKDFIYNSKLDDIIIDEFNLKNDKLIIAGPCTFGSYDEIYKIAAEIKKLGIKFLRAGVFKSRTNPNSFQGLQDEGIEMLLKVKDELGLHLVVELLTIEQVNKYCNDIDIIQIGSRNMYNYELLKAVGKLNKPVLLKRGFSATYKEWLMAAEYILKEGNTKVILCERGIRGFDSSETRNILDLQAVPYIKKNSNLPIIIDPSHASGNRYMVEDMSRASLVANADGLIIEVHTDPDKSLCDSEQTIDIDTLKRIIEFNNKIKNI